MKSLIAIALITAATPAFAQTTPAPAPTTAPAAPAAPAAPVAASRLNLDTPLQTIIADPAGKAVLTTDFGGMDISTNPMYEQIKSMSLNQLKTMAPDKLPDSLMTKVGTDLAAIK